MKVDFQVLTYKKILKQEVTKNLEAQFKPLKEKRKKKDRFK